MAPGGRNASKYQSIIAQNKAKLGNASNKLPSINLGSSTTGVSEINGKKLSTIGGRLGDNKRNSVAIMHQG